MCIQNSLCVCVGGGGGGESHIQRLSYKHVTGIVSARGTCTYAETEEQGRCLDSCVCVCVYGVFV